MQAPVGGGEDTLGGAHTYVFFYYIYNLFAYITVLVGGGGGGVKNVVKTDRQTRHRNQKSKQSKVEIEKRVYETIRNKELIDQNKRH